MANRTDFLRVTIESCEVVTVVAPTGDVEAGQLANVQDIVGVYAEARSAGSNVAFITRADGIIVPKKTGTGITFAIGDKVFFDAGQGQVTDSGDAGTGDLLCGYAKEVKGASDATVLITLIGDLSIVS